MNTIPTTFNERKVPHTIVGGTVKKSDEDQSPFTVILLNRGGRYYRSAVFQSLESAGFKSVISIELTAAPYDIENLSIRFPEVKFLVPLEAVTVGEMINTGIAETSSPFVFVVWNDIRVTPTSVPQRLLSRLSEEDILCIAPMLTSQKMENLPVQMVPALKGSSFQVEPMPCFRDSLPTVYPFDFTGIYNRDKFIRMGGFDHAIANPYWQNLDFGFRSHLWGERILLSSAFRLSYDGEVPREDITADAAYIRFYLKNLAPVFRGDESSLPPSAFFRYARKSGTNLLESWGAFSDARRWVRLNKYRFKRDAAALTAEWEPSIQ